jgi:hypothetical protein
MGGWWDGGMVVTKVSGCWVGHAHEYHSPQNQAQHHLSRLLSPRLSPPWAGFSVNVLLRLRCRKAKFGLFSSQRFDGVRPGERGS